VNGWRCNCVPPIVDTISGGFNIYLQVIETYRGEAAFVAPRPASPPLRSRRCMIFWPTRSAAVKMPVALEKLPRTSGGKLSKKELNEEERAPTSWK
jgi:acyl-CoA synthetase (AMP-forming)/AMP-acid ligase II